MMAALASVLAFSFFFYLTLGVVFSLVMIIFQGLNRIDPTTREATIGFKLIVLPATCALWPWLLKSWIKSGKNDR